MKKQNKRDTYLNFLVPSFLSNEELDEGSLDGTDGNIGILLLSLQFFDSFSK